MAFQRWSIFHLNERSMPYSWICKWGKYDITCATLIINKSKLQIAFNRPNQTYWNLFVWKMFKLCCVLICLTVSAYISDITDAPSNLVAKGRVSYLHNVFQSFIGGKIMYNLTGILCVIMYAAQCLFLWNLALSNRCHGYHIKLTNRISACKLRQGTS